MYFTLISQALLQYGEIYDQNLFLLKTNFVINIQLAFLIYKIYLQIEILKLITIWPSYI